MSAGGVSCSSHDILVGRLCSYEVVTRAMYKTGSLLAVAQEKPAQMGSQTHSLISHMTVDPDLDTMIHYGSLPSLY